MVTIVDVLNEVFGDRPYWSVKVSEIRKSKYVSQCFIKYKAATVGIVKDDLLEVWDPYPKKSFLPHNVYKFYFSDPGFFDKLREFVDHVEDIV